MKKYLTTIKLRKGKLRGIEIGLCSNVFNQKVFVGTNSKDVIESKFELIK